MNLKFIILLGITINLLLPLAVIPTEAQTLDPVIDIQRTYTTSTIPIPEGKQVTHTTHFPYYFDGADYVPYQLSETNDMIQVIVDGGKFVFSKSDSAVTIFNDKDAVISANGTGAIINSDSYVVRNALMGSDSWSALAVNDVSSTTTISEDGNEITVTFTKENNEGILSIDYLIRGPMLKATASFENALYDNHKFAFTQTLEMNTNILDLNEQTINLDNYVGQSFDKATLEQNKDLVMSAQNLYYNSGLGMENLWAIHIHADNKISLDYANDFLGTENQTAIGETVILDPTITLSELGANHCIRVENTPPASGTYNKHCSVGNYFWQWEGAGNRVDRFASVWDLSTVPSTATVTNINLQARQFGYGNYGAYDSGDCTFYEISGGWVGTSSANGQTGANLWTDMWSGTVYATISANTSDPNTGDQIGCQHPTSTNWGGPAYDKYHLGGLTSQGHATNGYDGFNASAISNINTAIANGDATWAFGVKKDVSSQTTTIKGHWWDQASLTLTYTAPTVPDVPTSLTATDNGLTPDLAWTVPASDGGSAITNYFMERSDSNFSTSNQDVALHSALNADRNYWMDAGVRDGFGIKIGPSHVLVGKTVEKVSFWASTDSLSPTGTYTIYAENNGSVVQNTFCSAVSVSTLTYSTATDGSGETEISCDTGSWIVNSNGGNDIIWITTTASNNDMLVAVDSTGNNPDEDLYINPSTYTLYANEGIKWATYETQLVEDVDYSAMTGSTSTTHTDTSSPTVATTWNYRVSAVNMVGTGLPSNVDSAFIGSPPDPPTGLTATITDVNATPLQVSLSWSAPGTMGSGTLSGYEIYRDGVLVHTNTLAQGTTHDDTVPASGTYAYTVKTVTNHGTSSVSNSDSVTTPNVPGTPSISLAINAPNANPLDVEITFVAPGSDGGSALTGYGLEFSSDNITYNPVPSTPFVGPTTTHTLATPGTWYYKATAINNVGTSTPTAPSSIITPSVPSQVQNLTCVADNPNQITLAWAIPTSDGGSVLTGYESYMPYSSNNVSHNTSTFTDIRTGLTANTAYTFDVFSKNNVGLSLTSACTETTPTAPTGTLTLTLDSIVYDTLQFSYNGTSTTGNPIPTVTDLIMKLDGTTIKTIPINAQLPIGNYLTGSESLKLPDLDPHSLDMTMTLTNTGSSVDVLSNQLSLQATFMPVYQPVVQGTGYVAWDLSRNISQDQLQIEIFKDTTPFNVNCALLTGGEASDVIGYNYSYMPSNALWSNQTSVAYFNTTTAINANDTYYVFCYEEVNPNYLLFSDTSFSELGSALTSGLAGLESSLGPMLGAPFIVLFVIMLAGQATGRTAPTFIIITVVVVGILMGLGFFAINEGVWGLLLIMASLGVLIGKKFL